jgi:hypothetical protein
MAAAMVLSAAWAGLALAASPIDPFVGSWTGDAVETANHEIPTDDLDIKITASGGGFELSWKDFTNADRDGARVKPLHARFTGAGRNGVFEYAPETGSFLDRMFASPDTGNPLDGETLLWARIDADALAVYSLTIDASGGYDLGHYTWTRTEDGLALLYRKRTEDLGEPIMIEGRLAPAGG